MFCLPVKHKRPSLGTAPPPSSSAVGRPLGAVRPHCAPSAGCWEWPCFRVHTPRHCRCRPGGSPPSAPWRPALCRPCPMGGVAPPSTTSSVTAPRTRAQGGDTARVPGACCAHAVPEGKLSTRRIQRGSPRLPLHPSSSLPLWGHCGCPTITLVGLFRDVYCPATSMTLVPLLLTSDCPW